MPDTFNRQTTLEIFFGGEGGNYPPGNGYISHQTGKGKSSTQNAIFGGDMLVPRRVGRKKMRKTVAFQNI